MITIYKWGTNDAIYRIDGGTVYKWGTNDAVYRIDGGTIYKWGTNDAVYRIDGGTVYKWGTNDAVYRIDGGTVYKWGTNDAVYRIDGGSSSSSSSEKPSGCLGWVLAFFGLIFWKLPIVGKICALIGIALPIVGAITGGNGNYILIVPFGFLIGGGIGALGNFVIPKLSKAGKLGTLIGAVVLTLAFEILLFTGNVSKGFGNIIGFAIFGLIIGAVVGAVVGSIIGFIRKKAGK